MKTADFLPPRAFAGYLDRQRTPRRIFLLFVFATVLAAGSAALELEVRNQEALATEVSRPDPEAVAARQELDGLFQEMSAYARRLDPLTEHLRMPTVGRMLAGLGELLGDRGRIERITWKHEVVKDRRTGTREGRVVMEIAAVVRGDDLVLELPALLAEHTGYRKEPPRTVRTELLPGRMDVMRVVVDLVGDLELPRHMRK